MPPCLEAQVAGNESDTDFLQVAKNCAERYRPGVPVSAFGENVKRIRTLRRMKAVELARRMKTDPSVISRWEQGHGGLPETPTLIRLARQLEVSVDDLLADVDPAYDVIVGKNKADRGVGPTPTEKKLLHVTSSVATSADAAGDQRPQHSQGEPHVASASASATPVKPSARLSAAESAIAAQVWAEFDAAIALGRLEQSIAAISAVADDLRRRARSAADRSLRSERAASDSKRHRHEGKRRRA